MCAFLKVHSLQTLSGSLLCQRSYNSCSLLAEENLFSYW